MLMLLGLVFIAKAKQCYLSFLYCHYPLLSVFVIIMSSSFASFFDATPWWFPDTGTGGAGGWFQAGDAAVGEVPS